MLKQLTYLLHSIVLLSALTAVLLASCSEYNTDSVGGKFIPVNSQVRAYTHQVYVEFSPEGVNVWGPCKDEVEASINEQHVSLQCLSDSLVIIAYGYPAVQNRDMDGSLSVHSDSNYALYLSGLSLHSSHGPAIRTTGHGTCFMVLTEKSKNELSSHGIDASSQGDGCIYSEGRLVLGGTGSLVARNLTVPVDSFVSHAISAGSFLCQYKVDVSLESTVGDGIHVRNSVRCSLGSWDINANRHGISAGDTIVLFAGSYSGTAAEGAFFYNELGAALRMPSVTVASAWASDVMDSLSTSLLFDSAQVVWQEQFLDVTLEPDSTYELVDTAGVKVSSIKSYHQIPGPYVLISEKGTRADAILKFK